MDCLSIESLILRSIPDFGMLNIPKLLAHRHDVSERKRAFTQTELSGRKPKHPQPPRFVAIIRQSLDFAPAKSSD
jgi:hypothetical protein